MQPSARLASVSFLAVEAVTKTYGDRVVLDDASCAFPPGGPTAVIGENGSGKSTLLRLLAGVEEPDLGRVVSHTASGLGYLPQDPPADSEGVLVSGAVDEALADVRGLERALRATEVEIARSEPSALAGVLARYAALQEEFTLREGYEADARVDRALEAVGLGQLDRSRTVGSLSGGQRARLRLATTLAAAPDVLLLDEPTNHLDESSLDWLDETLRGRRGVTVLVTHDRELIGSVATGIVEVDHERMALRRFACGYADFVAERERERVRWEQAREEWEDEVASTRESASTTARQVAHNRPARDNNKGAYKAKGGRVEASVSTRVRRDRERLRRLGESEVPVPPPRLVLSAALGGGRDGSVVAEAVAVAGRLRPVDLGLGPGENLLVTGENGSGKSTLLDVLSGSLAPTGGRVRVDGTVVAIQQESRWRSDTTAAAALARELGVGESAAARHLVASGLLPRDALHVPTDMLSSGQRRRLDLARLFAVRADVLLLDEPTNHLSPLLVDQLEEAIRGFRGTLVLVTHDRGIRARWKGPRLHLESTAGGPATETPAADSVGHPGSDHDADRSPARRDVQ